MVDLQANLQGSSMMDLQGNLHHQPEIHSIEASNTTQLSNEKQRLQDEEHRQRSSRHFTTQTTQSTEIVNSKRASTDLNTGSRYRSTGESTGCVRSKTTSTGSAGSTT